MQIKFLPFLICQLFTVRADQFDSGNITIVVSANTISTGQITFKKAFTTEPQVAILSFNFDIPTQAEFSFQIGNITKTKFDYKIKTLWNALNQYAFYWRAMDDKRIEVIYSYDTNVSGVGNKSFPFSHSKPCALYGFVSPLNFGVKGAIYFDLKVIFIVNLDCTNYKKSGYCGSHLKYYKFTFSWICDCIRIRLIIYKQSIYDQIQYSYYQSNIDFFICKSETWILIYFIMNSLNSPQQSTGTRMDYNNTVNNNNTISYSIITWEDTCFTSLTYQLIWINNIVFYPLLLKKMRFSKQFRMDLDSSYVKIQFLELNKSFNTITSQNIPISSSILNVTVIVQVHCYNGLKIVGSILQYESCELKAYTWNQQCYKGQNSIYFYIKLYQLELIDQQIQLDLQPQQVTITQSDINNIGSTNFKVLEITLTSA